MQTTLLGLGFAIILALVAALVGPLVIDWNSYRGLFEREASRLTGLDVHVKGAIDAHILPAPRIVLRDITFGDNLNARSLAVEFALTPLLRGEWRATELRLEGPRLRLALDKAGKRATAPARDFDPDALSVERLSVTDGSLEIKEAGGGAVALDKLWFNGDLRSLYGPIKGEGAVTYGGQLYPFRLSSGRLNNDGALRFHLNVDPSGFALNAEADGALTIAGEPHFEGTFGLSRPVGIALRGSDGLVTQPWQLSGKVKASGASALFEQAEFSYGSETQAVKLTGTAEFKFGAQPRFDGVLSARQLDFDALAADSGKPRAPPAEVLRRLATAASGAFRPQIPISIGVGIDQLTLGGADIQNVRGDLTSAADGWVLDRFEFRAPGFTEVRLSGRLTVDDERVTFRGPAQLAANDPNRLAAWLEGRPLPQQATTRPLRLRGDVTLGSETIAIERLDASFDREQVAGRFAYTFAAGGKGARLDAALDTPELDIDAAQAFVVALLGNSGIERPREISLALDIGRATLAGLPAGKTTVRLRLDGSGLEIERFAVENLGGSNVSASGKVALAPVPRGNLALDLDARDLTGLAVFARRYAPDAADALMQMPGALVPAKLHASLGLEGTSPGNGATLSVEGSAGTLKIAFKGSGSVDFNALSVADLHVQGRVDAGNGATLVKLMGVDRVAVVSNEPAVLRMTVGGNPFSDLHVTGSLAAGGLSASGSGTMQLHPGEHPTGTFYLNLARADLAPLRRGASAKAAAIPAALTARLRLSAQELVADEISAAIAGSRLRGKLMMTLDDARRVSGELDADTLDLAALIGGTFGVPASGDAWKWPAEPFAPPRLSVDADIALKATRAALSPSLAAHEWRARLRAGKDTIALDDISGTLAGGALTGRLALTENADGIGAHLNVDLRGADAAALWPGTARPPVAGKLDLQAEIEGQGRSPAALIGSLKGNGKVALAGGQMAGLDPRAFDTVIRAVDRGLPVQGNRIAELAGNALDSGQLAVKDAQGDVTINAGQIRLEKASARGEGADARLSGGVDLTSGTFDAAIILSGSAESAGQRPDIYLALRGPLAAPVRTIDVSALSGWLTMRQVERQSKRLQAIEGAAAAPALPPPVEITPKQQPGALHKRAPAPSLGPQN